ncbi:MAG TPA: ABC transporter substrate-binding protein [Candidatus Corynebacterium gallistercoris]|uniref:ABC transporter substrate-binding protein n=1 Tax=Candidatus Corynebacterium gallistercoris TaxID=2838530 RepID=A0A9D1RZT6_9CORY|nr:ABC transporter substrate-binding protein [Candidatus Corynebacterium gallistercoris]
MIAALTAAGLGLAACNSEGADSSGSTASSSATGSESAAANAEGTVTVEDNHGTQEIAVPAQRVASTDNRTFEVLDQWGVELVAAPKGLVPATVPDYKDNEDIADMGTHREPDLEALVAAQPDLIVNGQRFASQYEDIKKLNPDASIIELEPRDGEPFDEELRRQVLTLGEVFDKQDEAQQMVDDFDKALERAKKAYNKDQTVMAVNVSGGEIGYVAPGVGRVWGPVFEWLDLTPALEIEGGSENHEGDDISVEAIADSNPDWILALDRDAAISAGQEEGYRPAKDVLEDNAALKQVTALKEGHLVFAPEDTYTNESILTYTEILNQLADAFEGK